MKSARRVASHPATRFFEPLGERLLELVSRAPARPGTASRRRGTRRTPPRRCACRRTLETRRRRDGLELGVRRYARESGVEALGVGAGWRVEDRAATTQLICAWPCIGTTALRLRAPPGGPHLQRFVYLPAHAKPADRDGDGVDGRPRIRPHRKIEDAIKSEATTQPPARGRVRRRTWCGPCKVFEHDVLTSTTVRRRSMGSCASLRTSTESPGLEAGERYRVDGYPTFLVIDSHGVDASA